MQRRNSCLIIAGLANVFYFAGSTWADALKAEPDKRPRLVTQMGHSGDRVTAVAFSPDGKQVLTGGGYTARLWDAQSGKELRTFIRHGAPVTSVAFARDGKQVVTGGVDTARLWDAQSGKAVRSFLGHAKAVYAVAFSPDGRQVLTGSADNTARLWDAHSGMELRAFTGHTEQVSSVAFAPGGEQVLTGSADKTARLWDVASGKELRAFTGHTHWVYAAAFSPDGNQVLTGGDKTARLWNIASGKELRAFTGHSEWVHAAAFSPDGKQVLTGSDMTARLWDAQSGKELLAFTGHDSRVTSVAFAPDGKQVLTVSGDTARLWDAHSGKELRAFAGYAAGTPSSVAFAPDGRQVLTGIVRGADRPSPMPADQTARLWDAQGSKELRAFTGHTGFVNSVAFAPDGRQVLTGSDDNTTRLWDVQSGKQLRTFAGPGAGARHVEIRTRRPGGPLLVFLNDAAGTTSVAFAPDGKQVLTGSTDMKARLWDVASGKKLRTFAGHASPVSSVAFAPDGKQVVTGSYDKTAWLWDVASGKRLRTFAGHGDPVSSVAFAPDGKQVLTGSYDSMARLWDVASGEKLGTLSGHDATGVSSVAFAPDGKQVLTGSYDSMARLWDVASGKKLRTFAGHGDPVSSVAFAPDGKQVLTGSWDRTARLWDTHTGLELCKLISFRDGTWAVVDPEGRFDASNGGEVEGLHWVVGNEPIALKQLKERYYHPGLLAKYMGFNKEPLRQVAAFTDVKLFPEVAFAAPANSGKLTLNLTNRGGGIGRVQVFVNGKEVLADARGPKPDIDAEQSTLTVDLAGAPVIPGKPNQITVVTWNAEGYLSSRQLVREWTPAGEADPNPPELYVIVCGVSDYAEPRLKLRFAAKDAEDMGRAVELAGKRLFGPDNVHLTLLSTAENPKARKATKENLHKAFEAVRKAKPTDVLVVYLAGHGVALKQGADEYCYLTADARSTDTTALADPDVLALWAVTSSELVDWIKQIPALKQVMLLDTCAAGAAAARLMDHRDLSGDQVRALDRLKDRTGFHVLMGCASDRVSYEASQYSQGLLTYSLLQGMAGAKLREGEYVDVSGLFQYAADEVPNLARGIGGVQKPLVMAPRGTSFDIGRLVESDRKALPLAKPKPLILRPLLSNAEDGDDNLKLASLVRKRLTDDSFNTTRGTAVTTVYVDADELAGAVRPAGTYTIDGNKVSVRLVLKQDGQTINKMTVEGSTDDLSGLTAKIAEAIRQGIRKP